MGTTPLTIVGVAHDTRTYGLSEARNRVQIYTADTWRPETFARFILRTNGDPAALLRDARVRLAGIDNAVPIRSAQTGSDVFRQETAQHRFVVVLLSGVAGLGLLLALAGIYGTVALSLSQRAREMGIRLALGGSPARLQGAFVRVELRPVIIGALLGVAAAWMATPYMADLLFEVEAHDPISATMAAASVLITAILAAAIPARRMSRIDPARTLRAL
jgi:hypothetical protein